MCPILGHFQKGTKCIGLEGKAEYHVSAGRSQVDAALGRAYEKNIGAAALRPPSSEVIVCWRVDPKPHACPCSTRRKGGFTLPASASTSPLPSAPSASLS